MTERSVTPLFSDSDVVNTICAEGEVDDAEHFLNTLDRVERARFKRYFERLRDGHHIKSPENMRHISEVRDPKGKGAEVHELKSHTRGGLRLYVVRFEKRWYATHGVKKVKDRAVPDQARKAFRIFWGD